MNQDELKICLDAVMGSGAVIPTSLKNDLLTRYLDQEMPRRDHKLLFDVICFWQPQNEEGGCTEMEFDPFKPLLWQIEGSPQQHCQFFLDCFVEQMLLPCLKAGGDQSTSLTRDLAIAGLNSVDTMSDNVDEDILDTIGHVIQTLRCICALTDPMPGSAGSCKSDVEAVTVLCFQKPLSTTQQWMSQVGAVLKSQEH